ncbi:MAG: helix-turn-helix transcriptional regulator [Candidatus Methanoplasma sp.]|jgi:DNA-binding HxlR family transcriptional regulator|nr:helix-turn-helix transcriptional regulator [Candidatus Methanoplasma sp.]
MDNKTRGPRIDCALDAAMSVIGGRWKAAILCKLYKKGPMRFNNLMRELEAVSPRILTKQLREMEDDGLITRKIGTEASVSVEYSLSARGESLIPALRLLAEWSIGNMLQYNVRFDEGIIVPGRESRIS